MKELIKRLRKDARLALKQQADARLLLKGTTIVNIDPEQRRALKTIYIAGGYAYGLESAARRIQRAMRKPTPHEGYAGGAGYNEGSN